MCVIGIRVKKNQIMVKMFSDEKQGIKIQTSFVQ